MINYLGGLKRECHHIKVAGDGGGYEPTLVLFVEGRFGRSAMIPLSAMFKYDEPETDQEKEAVLMSCLGIAKHLGLETHSAALSQLAMFIADGLDDLNKLPPYEEKKATIGEVSLLADGKPISRVVEVGESEAFDLERAGTEKERLLS